MVSMDMGRIHPECPDSDPSGRSVTADILLRQGPDEEDEEEDEGDGKEETMITGSRALSKTKANPEKSQVRIASRYSK